MTMTTAEADTVLSSGFTPWVEVGEHRAPLRTPWSGQALTAMTGPSTVITVPAARDGFVPLTTGRRSTTSQGAVAGSDVLIEVALLKPGLPRRSRTTLSVIES